MPTSTDAYNLCVQALIILLLPLAAFLVQVFFSTKIPPRQRQGDWIPTLAMFVGLAIAAKMFFVDLLGSSVGIERQLWYPFAGATGGAFLEIGAGGEAAAGAFRMDFGILVDNLTIVMLFVVTLVSFLVHLYSWGYMHGEVRYNRFFAYLALFSFSMLGLCITSNLLFCFIFWELVGLCSYFLIGFYFEKKSAQNASIKAFMTTRVGDLGFFLAIMIIASMAGTLEFDGIFESMKDTSTAAWTAGLLTFAAVCLFIGPMGKSGQFPLHVWLPDAMEGPTPVSALIHAATMVAAGVYLVGRMFPFMAGPEYFSGDFWSSDALLVVAMIGGFTSIFAASIAFVQTDIKKVLAYSTVSQLGYMMLGLGMGSVAAGLFHLTTHAMFKALLFLCSGSVIHAVHSNEMDDMGGLWKKMRITWITFLVGTLAIAGLPFLSGFYSKEAILTQAMAVAEYKGGVYWLPFIFGMITALMTAFYMFRLYFKTFHGEPRNTEAHAHAHESPWTMTVPLSVLALLSVTMGGVMGYSHRWFEHRVNPETLYAIELPAESRVAIPEEERFEGGPAFQSEVQAEITEAHHHAHYPVLGMSIASFILGVLGAWLFFGPRSPLERRNVLAPEAPLGRTLRPLTYCLTNLWFVDAFYNRFVLGLLHALRIICGMFDRVVVDGIVNLHGLVTQTMAWVVGRVDNDAVDGSVRGVGWLTLALGRSLRRLQTGSLQEYVYASVFLCAGVVLAALAIINLAF